MSVTPFRRPASGLSLSEHSLPDWLDRGETIDTGPHGLLMRIVSRTEPMAACDAGIDHGTLIDFDPGPAQHRPDLRLVQAERDPIRGTQEDIQEEMKS